jgi:hypothetical protein
MKKQIITLTIILGMAMTGFAQSSMFHRENSGNNGNAIYQERSFFTKEGGTETPLNPGHGQGGNQDAAPLGSGIVMLTALGAAYLVGKKRREE